MSDQFGVGVRKTSAGPWKTPKLTSMQWKEIGDRYVDGESIRDLADEFGISASSIRKRVAGSR